MADIMGYKDFYAHCNHMPQADHALKVGGKVTLPTTDWSVSLGNPRSGGINPELLELDLTITPPPPDVVVSEVVTDQEIEEFCDEGPSNEYKEVHFHLVGREDEEAPPPIEVDHTY